MRLFKQAHLFGKIRYTIDHMLVLAVRFTHVAIQPNDIKDMGAAAFDVVVMAAAVVEAVAVAEVAAVLTVASVVAVATAAVILVAVEAVVAVVAVVAEAAFLFVVKTKTDKTTFFNVGIF